MFTNMGLARFAAVFLVLPVQRAFGGEFDNTRDCIKNTGGTCNTASCFSWRGPTDCRSNGLAQNCFCTGNTCAGGDGVCSDRPYNKSGIVYRIKNAKWPDYYIDIDLSGDVSVESSGADETDNQFTISTPYFADVSAEDRNADDPESVSCYLIYSVEWPDAVLMVHENSNNNQRGLLPTCQNVYGSWGAISDPSIVMLGMILTRAPAAADGEDPPVMLSSMYAPSDYFYVPEASHAVMTHHNDPGAGGYWYFEPRLPKEVLDSLPSYRGRRCTHFCGTVASSSVATPSAQGGASSVLFAVLAAIAAAAAMS